MALISCPACSREVSSMAPTCPGCGHPIAPPLREAPPQRIVVQQPRSGAGGVLGCLFLLLLLAGGAWLFFGTDLGKQLLGAGRQLTDQQRIVGKWQGNMDSMEFLSNGDLVVYAALRTNKGTWKMTGDQEMQLDLPGIFYGRIKGDVKYELDGDTLKLTPVDGANVTLEYHREK
ncbi:MAG TPA: hypothetical protein VMS17_08250 [Gemmataceae bacterium]|nr:hypothetical protein [Gemmataceae bacterium]